MQIALLILVFIILLGALAWHGGRDLWTQRSSPKSKLYYGMAAALGLVVLCSTDMTTSSEISTGPFLVIAVVIAGSISRRYRIYRQQHSI
ncbi:MAG: hypothetical protein OXD43_09560 [Bacteroidetes bacterium]|nr:hypothetical protein [Bacteroidota bacterium]